MTDRRCQDCGKLVSPAATRCSPCERISRRHLHPTRHQARKRAQRARRILTQCEHPGCTETHRLERHHPDIDRFPDWIEVLCYEHHKLADVELERRRLAAECPDVAPASEST